MESFESEMWKAIYFSDISSTHQYDLTFFKGSKRLVLFRGPYEPTKSNVTEVLDYLKDKISKEDFFKIQQFIFENI